MSIQKTNHNEVYSEEVYNAISKDQFEGLAKMKEEECEPSILSAELASFIGE